MKMINIIPVASCYLVGTFDLLAGIYEVIKGNAGASMYLGMLSMLMFLGAIWQVNYYSKEDDEDDRRY